jgi:predicted nucleic acid-binding protein
MGSAPLTKLDDALASVTALGFDTSPFIYFVERHPTYLDLLRELFQQIDDGRMQGFASVVTLTEVLTMPKQHLNRTLETEYRNIPLSSRYFTLIPIDSAIAESAAELRARHRLGTPDALQIAAALSAGCQAFITNDRALRRVTELQIYTLDDLEL